MPMYRSKSGPEPMFAYTVRPDLWPPGIHCWLAHARLAAVGDEDWIQHGFDHSMAYEAPGAVESLILAGHQVVLVGHHLTSDDWEEWT